MARDVAADARDFDCRVAILDIGGGFHGIKNLARYPRTRVDVGQAFQPDVRLESLTYKFQTCRGEIRPRDNVTAKIGVAIVGASGYAARELVEILLRHPQVQITAATSRQDEAPRLDALHPSLARRIDLICEVFDADRIADRASFAFLALPHTASMAVVPSLRQRGVRVIDLSADYRLTDAQVYADWYGHAHTDPEGLRTAVYGLPELFRERIPPVQLVANPGCYTSASILALAPLIAADLIERGSIIIDAEERSFRGGPLAQAGLPLRRMQREPLRL